MPSFILGKNVKNITNTSAKYIGKKSIVYLMLYIDYNNIYITIFLLLSYKLTWQKIKEKAMLLLKAHHSFIIEWKFVLYFIE